MNNRRWTNNELLLLAEYFPKGDLSILSSKIGRSLSSIHGKASQIGLKRIVKGNNCPDKKCIKCGEVKPRTDEYFYKRTSEQKLANGEVKTYIFYKSLCKKCHCKDTHDRSRKKRAKELGITFDQYLYLCKWFMKHGIKNIRMRQLYEENPGLFDDRITKIERRTIRKWILNGYKFTDYDTFKVDQLKAKKERFRKKRKYHDLPEGYNFYHELPNDLKNKILRSRKPTKGVIANWLGIKVHELDLETEKTKRLLHNISRYIKIEEGKNEICV